MATMGAILIDYPQYREIKQMTAKQKFREAAKRQAAEKRAQKSLMCAKIEAARIRFIGP